MKLPIQKHERKCFEVQLNPFNFHYVDKQINTNKINLKASPTLKTEWIFQYENSCWDLKGKKWSITACLFRHWPLLSLPSPFCWEPRVRSQEVSSSHFMTWPTTQEEVKLWPSSHLQLVSLFIFSLSDCYVLFIYHE